jgi:hypothetical protein
MHHAMMDDLLVNIFLNFKKKNIKKKRQYLRGKKEIHVSNAV